MNLPQQRHFKVPIVFDSDDSYSDDEYEESEYDSQDSDNESANVIKPEIKPRPKIQYIPKPPSNNSIQHPLARRRPILRPQTNSMNQKAKSIPENIQNDQSEQENSLPLKDSKISKTQNEINIPKTTANTSHFEIEQTEFVELHTYALSEKRNNGVFKKSRTFTLLDHGKPIHQATLNSLSKGKVKLTKDIVMHIRDNRTEFVFKTNEKKSKSLSVVSFSTPYSFEECKRKTTIRFGHNTGGMLPHKIVSLPTADEAVFDGHYFVKSKRNVAFAVVNNSKPVLSVRQIQSDMMEIDTILNISTAILFGLSIALYIGKNRIPPTEIAEDDKAKFQILNISKLMRNT